MTDVPTDVFDRNAALIAIDDVGRAQIVEALLVNPYPVEDAAEVSGDWD